MAKFIITNREHTGPIYKSFRVNIIKLCSMVKLLPNVLYHTGDNPKPITGDIIYTQGFTGFTTFNNNTAALTIDNKFLEDSTNTDKLFLKTDFNGKCTIIICNNNGDIHDNN